MIQSKVYIVGAGLAGCECAYILAQQGISVVLCEMKPHKYSPAHGNENFAELVCSNSFRSSDLETGIGLLKSEMQQMGSLTMHVAQECAVPAGKALAVDRDVFARKVTEIITAFPNVTVERREITSLDDAFLSEADYVVLASGPLTSDSLSADLARLTGAEHLYFYDAIAPIVAADSVDMSIAFWGSRYDEGDGSGDYINCPMNKEEYYTLYNALLTAEKVKPASFEQELHFEGCMPIEALAERGERTLVFGSFKPVGFTDPRTGQRPYAVVQLRTENLNKNAFNLVGCQTKLTYPAQEEVFRIIPGLEHVEFLRMGSIHRNTYVNAPQVLDENLALRMKPHVFVAGQLAGVEGYVESAACGLWLGHSLAAILQGKQLPMLPDTAALGGLLAHLRTPVKRFQPSNCHYGLMPDLNMRAKKKERKALYSKRTQEAFAEWFTAQKTAGFFAE